MTSSLSFNSIDNMNHLTEEEKFQKMKFRVKWGTYGKGGNEPLRYVRLIDCSSEHLVNIIKNLNSLGCCLNPQYETLIREILKDRKYDIPASL